MNFIRLLTAVAKFVVAIPLGGLLGGAIATIGHPISSMRELVSVVLGVGGALAIFGAFPAVIFGVPALLAIRKLKLDRIPAVAAMSIGGTVCGAVITALLPTLSFTTLGTIAGGSIGLTLGLLAYQRPARQHVVTSDRYDDIS